MHRTLCILLLLISPLTWANRAIQLVTEQAYPEHFLNKDKEVIGPVAEIIETIINDADIKHVTRLLPWSMSYRIAITQPNVLIYSIRRTKFREDKFMWIGPTYREANNPWVEDQLRVFFWSNKEFNKTISSFDEARPFKVIVVRGDYLAELLINEYQWERTMFVYVDSLDDAFGLLSQRSNLIMPMDSQYPVDTTRFKSVFEFPQKLSDVTYFAFSKGSDPSLLKKIKTSYEKVMKDGRYDEIIQKWAKELNQ